MSINWIVVQKAVEGGIILGWEHWLSQTTLVKAGSTVELIWNGLKLLFKKGEKNVKPTV
jgi:hypothetical protein